MIDKQDFCVCILHNFPREKSHTYMIVKTISATVPIMCSQMFYVYLNTEYCTNDYISS